MDQVTVDEPTSEPKDVLDLPRKVFTLEYDFLCPVQLPHVAGVHMLSLILRMWYTSMVACVGI